MTKNGVKYLIGLIVCFFIRLLPFRPPNVEPIMTTTMPFSKRFGRIAGFLFGFASIVIFDLATQKLGIWTLVTGIMYGLVGTFAASFFKKRKATRKNFVSYAVIATLAYDFITGPIMSSMIFDMSFAQSLIGQVPFTLYHLAGNIFFALTISPVLYTWVVDNRDLELHRLLHRITARF